MTNLNSITACRPLNRPKQKQYKKMKIDTFRKEKDQNEI